MKNAPQIYVKLQSNDGAEFEVVSDIVLGIEYDDEERRADKLVLSVDNKTLANFDDPVWKKGGKLLITWGHPGRMRIQATAVIQKVTGFTVLKVVAHAESVVMNTKSKCRSWDGTTRSEVVRQIAEENGYGVESTIIDSTYEVHEVISQYGITDAQFINRLAKREGFEFYVDHQGFHWHSRRLGSQPTRVIRYYTGNAEILAGVVVDNDVTKRPGRVRVEGRDPTTGQDIVGVADNLTDSERPTLSENSEIILAEEYSTRAVETLVAQEETVSSASATTQEAADREARTRFRRAQHVAVKMTIPMIGDVNLFAKTVIQIEGMGQRLSQRYWVKHVKHMVNQNGYTMKVKLVSDGHGGHSTESSAARGLSVVNVGRARRGGAGGASSRDEILAAIAALELEVRNFPSEEANILIIQARNEFEANGMRSAETVRRAARAIASEGGVTDGGNGVLQAGVALSNLLAQAQTDEAATGGRPNRQNAPGDDGEEPQILAMFEELDGDAFETRTGFAPAESPRADET